MKDSNYWESLVKSRRLDSMVLKVRMKEMTFSRDVWKEKAMKNKEENIFLNPQLTSIRKKINQINDIIKRDKPRKIHFNTVIISLLIHVKIQTACGFRSASGVLSSVLLSLTLDFSCPKAPTKTSCLLWVKKLGYYRLVAEKEKAEDWILVIDESIGIGQESLLVVLGVRRNAISPVR